MTSLELKTQIDTDITDKTAEGSVSPENVGENMKDVVDYVDQEIQAVYDSAVSYVGQQINALTVVNSTTSALSAATLNSTYPMSEAYPLGVRVHCRSISGGGLVYERVTSSAWISQSITSVS